MSAQPLLGAPFYGDDYVPERDGARLTEQQRLVFDIMRDRRWRTPNALQHDVLHRHKRREPIQSLLRQLRYLRQPEHGGYSVLRRHKGDGLYEYRLVEPGHPDAVAHAKPPQRVALAKAARQVLYGLLDPYNRMHPLTAEYLWEQAGHRALAEALLGRPVPSELSDARNLRDEFKPRR